MKNKNIEKEEIIKKGTKVFSEFKSFIAKGNVIELAVGVIIGSAFGKIVTSLVSDILMPIIGIVSGGIDFSGLSITIEDSKISYGMFIQNVIDFLIIAICVFAFVKIIGKMTKKKEDVEEVKKDEQVVLLEQIRDILQNQKSEIEK